MSEARQRPSDEELRQFQLGTLEPAAEERVTEWVARSPEADDLLSQLPVQDTLTDLLTIAEQPPTLSDTAVNRVVSRVGQNLGLAMDAIPAVPDTIGKYRVLQVLGRGGMGVVYEAVDERLGRRVAVKVLSEKLAADAVARERFLHEGKALADVHSQHVVAVYDADEAAGRAFLVMEFLRGATLAEWARDHAGPMSADELIWAAREVLLGLAAIHGRGLVHRDIKPANLCVEKDARRIKLLDLGLSRSSQAGNPVTQTGAILGTPAYMSPEQANGRPADQRSDLFSLGVVLYRLVAGRSPFEKETLTATLNALGNENPPLLTGIPRQLSEFVAKLLNKQPGRRFQNTAEALAELQNIEQHLPRGKPLRSRRPRRTATALVLAGLVLAAGLIVIIRNRHREPIAQVIVNDKAANGGQVDVIAGTGKVQTLNLPLTTKKAELEPGSRIIFTKYTAGYEADRTIPRIFIDEGTTGTLIRNDRSNNHRLIRLDKSGDEFWILRADAVAAK